MGMKLKTLLALLVVAHALAHPAVHTLPVLTPPQAQSPAAPDSSPAQVVGNAPCPACAAQRAVVAVPVLISAITPRWQPLVPRPQTSFLSFDTLARPARAPPLA